MTDDDRMERARRIREMREGLRSDDHPETDTAADATDDPASASETGPAQAGSEASDGTATGEEGTMQTAAGPTLDVDLDDLAEQAGLSTRAAEGDGEGTDDGTDEPDATEAGPAGVPGAAGLAEQQHRQASDETRVLEFSLGPEQYCLAIEYVEEIVTRDTVTRVPNTPDFVEGVVDLRGQITTILDPKVLLDIDATGLETLIVVFDPDRFDDQGAIGWFVDDVNRVMPVADDEVISPPVDQPHVRGVVERDEAFVIWADPELDAETLAE